MPFPAKIPPALYHAFLGYPKLPLPPFKVSDMYNTRTVVETVSNLGTPIVPMAYASFAAPNSGTVFNAMGEGFNKNTAHPLYRHFDYSTSAVLSR